MLNGDSDPANKIYIFYEQRMGHSLPRRITAAVSFFMALLDFPSYVVTRLEQISSEFRKEIIRTFYNKKMYCFMLLIVNEILLKYKKSL